VAKWQRGYPLEGLRALTQRFSEHDGPRNMGAFTAVKERTVADWLAAGRLHALDSALVVMRRAKTGRQIDDFVGGAPRGRYEPGALLIDKLAGPAASALELLDQAGAAGAEQVVFVGWWDHQQDSDLARALGLTANAVKVRASSEMLTVWTRGIDWEPVNELDGPALARLPLEFDAAQLLAEVEAQEPGWQQHYSSYNKRKSWTAVSLRSYGGDWQQIVKPAEMSRAWKAEHPEARRWKPQPTELWDQLPECARAAGALGTPLERVRLMRLAPGGELSRHADITDKDAGTALGRTARLHLPLHVPAECTTTTWQVDGPTISRLEPGAVWYLDTRKPHAVWNRAAEARTHLVVDAVVSRELQRLLQLGEVIG